MNKENEEVSQQPSCSGTWTKDLKSLPPFTHDLLQKHLIGGDEDVVKGAHKHKKLGYQLFKDRYVSNIQVKPNVTKGDQLWYLIKGSVHAAMKKNIYTMYVHLHQVTGSIGYANCSCKAGRGGCCKHIAALLFQILDYIQLELKEVPDNVTSTQLLQQWHVPRADESDEAVLFEDIKFEKASLEKDQRAMCKR